MARDDYLRIALRALRAILAESEPFYLEIEGSKIDVRPEQLPAPVWPADHARGLSETEDGPWPAPLDLNCTWEGGNTELRIKARAYSERRPKQDEAHIALTVYDMRVGRRIARIAVTKSTEDAVDGQSVSIPMSFTTVKRQADASDFDQRGMAVEMRQLLQRSKLPTTSPANAQTFKIRVPSGEVEPSPKEALHRLAKLSLMKLPFVAREKNVVVLGAPPFELPAIKGPAPQPRAESTPYLGMYPLPGGVRAYKKTLDDILGWISESPRTTDDLNTLLAEQYESPSKQTQSGHKGVLLRTGLVEEDGEQLTITETGSAYLDDPTSLRLFEILNGSFRGLLETLVLAELLGVLSSSAVTAMHNNLLGTNWNSPAQANTRRNWLLSLNLTERTGGVDVLTSLGRDVLGAHRDEVEALRAEINPILDEIVTGVDLDDEEEPESNEESIDEPPGWSSGEHVDLTPSKINLSRLRLPAFLVEQASAALSSGKHLLLVGPPGTGKTELAHILAEAAKQEGYCRGLFAATASADWTTFDTIGGYALESAGKLAFRSGVFLRALEQFQWLLIDEINRADIDKAFGELMTVLSGKGTDTAFQSADGRLVSVGPEEGRSHRVPRTFRVIGTMNTWDKTSLFRLSYAVQRRFAIINVDIPDSDSYSELLREAALRREGFDPPLEEAMLLRVTKLFSHELLSHRRIGPAVPLDMIRYLRRRRRPEGLAEATSMLLLSQLEGLEIDAAAKVLQHLRAVMSEWTPDEAFATLEAQYCELFPQLELD